MGAAIAPAGTRQPPAPRPSPRRAPSSTGCPTASAPETVATAHLCAYESATRRDRTTPAENRCKTGSPCVNCNVTLRRMQPERTTPPPTRETLSGSHSVGWRRPRSPRSRWVDSRMSLRSITTSRRSPRSVLTMPLPGGIRRLTAHDHDRAVAAQQHHVRHPVASEPWVAQPDTPPDSVITGGNMFGNKAAAGHHPSS